MSDLLKAFTDLWFYWLLFFLLSWLVFEIGSILWAKYKGEKNIFDWTLSDTIRRWSAAHRWLAPLSTAVAAFLWYHFFLQSN